MSVINQTWTERGDDEKQETNKVLPYYSLTILWWRPLAEGHRPGDEVEKEKERKTDPI